MPKVVVLSDSLGYIQDGVIVRALKGAEVELSQEDYDRHLPYGSVAKVGSKEAKAALEADAAGQPELEAPEAA